MNIYIIDNRLTKLIQNFYVEKVHSLFCIFQRSYQVSIFLYLVKAFYFLTMLFTQSSLNLISQKGKGFNFFSEIDLEVQIDSMSDSLIYLQIAILIIDLVLLAYIFFKFVQYSQQTIQGMKNIHLQGMNINTGETQFAKNSSIEIMFSMIFQTYEYILIIPSIYLAIVLQSSISIPSLALSIFNGLIIKDLDFDYLISTKDFLAKRYTWYEKIVYLAQCLFISLYSTQKGAVGIWMILLCILLELFFILFKKPYYSKHMEGIIIWILLFLSMVYSACLWLRTSEFYGPSLFFIILSISLPISLKVSRVIMHLCQLKVQRQFEILMNSNTLLPEDNCSPFIDQIIRQVVYPEKVFLNNQEKEFFHLVLPPVSKELGEYQRELFKVNLLRTFQIKLITELEIELQALKRQKAQAQSIGGKGVTKKLMKSSNYSEGSNYDDVAAAERQIDAYQEAKNDILSQQYALDEQIMEGKTYIDKNQVYGEDKIMADNLQMYFHRVIQNSKDKTEFSDIDILHLVYILEILGNEKLFELKLNQTKKKISFKHQQILNTLQNRVQVKKVMHIREYGKESLFHPEYQESLSYDNLIQSLQHWIDETIEKKLQVLNVMRQRHISLTQLKDLLEDVQFRRRQIIKTISHLVQLNDKNSQLHALYICYLENLSFTDKDINLNKFKKQQMQNIDQKTYLAKLDRSDSCVVFSNISRNNKGMVIRKTSKTFERIFSYKSNEIINQPIEKLLPYPYQRHHARLTKDFFNDTQQNDKGNVPLGLGLTQKGYVLPLEIGIRVISFQGEFGMAAFIQVIDKSPINFDPLSISYNFQQTEYLIYDETNLKVISMTIALHNLLFFRYKSIHSIFLRGFFPFLRKIYQNNSLRSSHTNRSGGRSSNTLLQSSRYMNSNRSVSSSRKRAEIKKQETQKAGKKKNKKKDDQPFDGSQQIQGGEQKKKKDKKEKEENRDKSSSISKGQVTNLDIIQFLMIVQIEDQLSDDQSPQFIEKNFQFFTMIVKVCENKLGGNDRPVTYLEITKIQEINAFNSSAFLLNVFDDQLEVMTNKQFFTQMVANRIVEHLEKFYLFQQLVQSGDIDLSKYNMKNQKLKLKSSWQQQGTRYSNNELYQFYLSKGHIILPEVINEQEIEKEKDDTVDNSKLNDQKQTNLQKWLNKAVNGMEPVKQGSQLHEHLLEESIDKIEKFFDGEGAHAPRGVNKYDKQISKDKSNNRQSSTLEYAKNVGEDYMEPVKKFDLKGTGTNDKQIHLAQPKKENLGKSQQKSTEDFSLVNSQIELQESFAQNINKQKLQNQQYMQNVQKPRDLNDIIYESKLDSPQDQANKIQLNYNNPFPSTPQTGKDFQVLGFPLSPSQSITMNNIQNSGQKGYELTSPAGQQLIPKFNMDANNSQITPSNSQTQHAVFGAAAFQNQNNTFQQLNQDVSQQQLVDQSKIHNMDSYIMSPYAAATTGIYYDYQGIPFSNNSVFTPMNSNGQAVFPQQNMFSPNNVGSQNEINQYQSQNSIMNQSQNNGQVANINNNNPLNESQNQKTIYQSKTSKFFSSKLNQVSQLKSIRSKLNSQTFGNQIPLISTMNPGSDPSKGYSAKSNTGDDNDERKTKQKEYQNIQDAGESSSTHSKLSNLSSQKKQVNHIIFSTKDLNAMKIINVFGLLSIAIIISVTLYQYYSMNTTFSDFESDSEIADWPMRFISNMASIFKGKNYINLMEIDFFKFTQAEAAQQSKEINEEIATVFERQLTRLTELHRAQSNNQLFMYMLDSQYIANVSSLFGEDTDLSKVSSNDDNNFKAANTPGSIFYGCTLIYSYLYRYVYGSGIPRGQYISLLNEDRLEIELAKVFSISQEDQIVAIDGIRTQLTSLMVLILVICPLCVSIVVPLYAFIQSKRQEILTLFGTFSIQRLDQCIQDTRFTNFYIFDPSVGQQTTSQKQNMLTKLLNHNNETQKKQTLSSSTPLPKISIALIFCAILVFVFTLPYPIINQQISNRYMDESQIALKLKTQLSQLRANLIQAVGNIFFCFYLKTTPQKMYDISKYQDKLSKAIGDINDVQLKIQQTISEISALSMYQYNFYNVFIPNIFEISLCKTFVQNPDFVAQTDSVTKTLCDGLMNGLPNQGAFFNLKDYSNLIEIPQLDEFNKQYQEYRKSIRIFWFNSLQIILESILNNLTDAIDVQNRSYYNYMLVIQIILMVYQFIIVGLVLVISWIMFYVSLRKQLNNTKQLLSVLDIYSIINNPYIHNFLIQNLKQ